VYRLLWEVVGIALRLPFALSYFVPDLAMLLKEPGSQSESYLVELTMVQQ
jgi:hypothetical protein